MSIVFMMPQWEAASEVWMQRMIEGLAQDIAVIAVNDSHGNKMWKDRIPVISLNPPDKRIRFVSSFTESIGYSVNKILPKSKKLLLETIRKYEVTHVLCQYGGFATRYMNVWHKTDAPLFIHFHGYDTFFDLRQPDQPNKPIHSMDYLENLHLLEKRATFITGSNFMKSKLVEAGLLSENIIVKHYGVPVVNDSHLHTRVRNIQILHLGRLVDFKSPDRTIQAFEIARSKGLDGHLVMIGDGPLKITCELMRIRSPYRDSIQILDSVPPKIAREFYLESDIYTQHNITGEVTRQAEGFGVSILEVMAAGTPFVGTRSGGVVESVVDGETGILNTPGDVEAQAEAFLKLAADPELRQRMGDAGRARVAQHFTPQKEAARLREIMGLAGKES